MKKMLIDATNASEIRLAIVNDKTLENYEFEPKPSQYTKGNVYLAKVVRVEPALQAAFVEYADNTQGFLPFSEIHPDYYRIPVEDYEALMAEQRERVRQAAERDPEDQGVVTRDIEARDENPAEVSDAAIDDGNADVHDTEVVGQSDGDRIDKDKISVADGIDDVDEPAGLVFTPKIVRRYKIQEVIKRGQLMLVQVTKEERGNKRAALSTYIALAGCYCVLIPNALFNGGVSRKIEAVKERKRLKKMMDGLGVPEGMALILRTAAEGRTKASIARDLKYLLKLWDEMRQKTLDSVAPLLIYEEADLVNRSLRDIFSKQIEEVHIAGAEAFAQAKQFTRQLNPRLTKNIREHPGSSGLSLFESFGLEAELQQLIDTEVVMPSGGALVIEQTEALVSIDINSSKAIGERNIEETALKINLEAAEEIARQLRLRDLAGLIVIDFIDMERKSNQQKVERTLKQCLKNDKARMHVGRISSFGLLEMSRQRLGPSILEKTTSVCPRCHGRGLVLTEEATALALVRALRHRLLEHGENQDGAHRETTESDDADADKSASKTIRVECLPQVAQALMNAYLGQIAALENEFGVNVQFVLNADLQELYGWRLESGRSDGTRRERHKRRGERRGRQLGEGRDAESETKSNGEKRNGRRRRQRTGDAGTTTGTTAGITAGTSPDSPESADLEATTEVGVKTEAEGENRTGASAETGDKGKPAKKTSRRRKKAEMVPETVDAEADPHVSVETPEANTDGAEEDKPRKKRARRFGQSRRSSSNEASSEANGSDAEAADQANSAEGEQTRPVKARKTRRKSTKADDANEKDAADTTPEAEARPAETVRGKPDPSISEEIKPRRRGWWNNFQGN